MFNISVFMKNLAANKRNNDTYLEIGVSLGDTFKVVDVKNKFGVDINKDFVATHYMSSDEFFILAAEKALTFDLIFIDGDHSYTQVVNDFNNALKFIKNDGVIVVHDLIPPDEEHSSPRGCGDGYKMLADVIDNGVVDTFSVAPIDQTLGTTVFYHTNNIKTINKTNDSLQWVDFMKHYIKRVRFLSHKEAISIVRGL
jgi:hypothetical protein